MWKLLVLVCWNLSKEYLMVHRFIVFLRQVKKILPWWKITWRHRSKNKGIDIEIKFPVFGSKGGIVLLFPNISALQSFFPKFHYINKLLKLISLCNSWFSTDATRGFLSHFKLPARCVVLVMIHPVLVNFKILAHKNVVFLPMFKQNWFVSTKVISEFISNCCMHEVSYQWKKIYA